MTEEDISHVAMRYRSTVADEPSSALDEVILGAASRRAVRVRMLRRSAVVLALAAVVLWPFWRAHVVRAPQTRNVNGYGLQEGVTRYYLLNAARVQYTGPGSTEGKQ